MNAKIIKKRFIVNEDKNIVVCIIKWLRPYMEEELHEIDKFNLKNVAGNFRLFADSFETVGIARCMPEDKFDEITGKEIAEKKAIMKGKAKMKRFTDKTVLFLEKLEQQVKGITIKLSKEELNLLKRIC